MAKKKLGEFPFSLDDWIPIFASGGRYPQMVTESNPDGFVSQDILTDIATSYDPNVLMAPITTDHEKHGEAKGRIADLRVQGNKLMMKVKSVVNEFRDALKEGRYLYPSVELYDPSHHANPTPGRWYLRAVSYLGAAIPAVKGLYAGFSESWTIQESGGRVLCFCSELNNQTEIEDMTKEEIQSLLDSAFKSNNEALVESVSAHFEPKFKELDAKISEATKPTRKSDDDPDFVAQFNEKIEEERKRREAAEARLKSLETIRETEQKQRLSDHVRAFNEKMITEKRCTPAEYKERFEKHLNELVESGDEKTLHLFTESILSTVKENTVFAEVIPDVKTAAETSGLTIEQEAQVRRFGEEFGPHNATEDNLSLAREGLKLFNEAKSKKLHGADMSEYDLMLESMVTAQKRQLLGGTN